MHVSHNNLFCDLCQSFSSVILFYVVYLLLVMIILNIHVNAIQYIHSSQNMYVTTSLFYRDQHRVIKVVTVGTSLSLVLLRQSALVQGTPLKQISTRR